MGYDVPLTTRITSPVDRRLRMLAIVRGQPLSHLLVTLLDEALPPADVLVSQLLGGGETDEPAKAVA